jgi:integrase/recombinase XerD
MTGLLTDYETYLLIERAMSRNTVASYCSDVEKFITWVDLAPEKVGPDDVAAYLASRHHVSERSQARFLSALRNFYDWLYIEGVVTENPCEFVDMPKLGRYIPVVLSVEEVEAMIDSVDTASSTGIRDRAILEVLYGCGLRVSEAVGLRISCLFPEEGFIRVFGKGKKERLIPFCGMARESVMKYLEVRPLPADSKSDDHLFLNNRGTSLSRVSMFKMVKKQALLADIRKEISPHTFRHSFATHMIQNGADLKSLQEMLGHSDISTTQMYVDISLSHIRDVYAKSHPRK